MGELWDVETIFQVEEDVALRIWKRNLLEELSMNLKNYRRANGFTSVELNTVESFRGIFSEGCVLVAPYFENSCILEMDKFSGIVLEQGGGNVS